MMSKITISLLLVFTSVSLFDYTLTSERTVIIQDTVHMSKNVILETGDFIVTTDTALFFRKDSIVIMPRSVKIMKKDSITIDAEKGIYLMKGKYFKLLNQRTVKENSFIIESESLEILMKDSLFFYSKGPILYFDGRESSASGDTIEYSFSTDTMKIYNKSLFRKKAGYEAATDTIIIMIEDSLYSFFHKCLVKTDSMTLETDSLLMFRKEDYAKTFKRTLIKNESVLLESDSVRMTFRNDSLDFLIAYRNVCFSSNDENQKIKIECDSVESDIEENKMKKTFFYLIKSSELETREENDTEK